MVYPKWGAYVSLVLGSVGRHAQPGRQALRLVPHKRNAAQSLSTVFQKKRKTETVLHRLVVSAPGSPERRISTPELQRYNEHKSSHGFPEGEINVIVMKFAKLKNAPVVFLVLRQENENE